MSRRIGLVTIGQSPRDDVTKDLYSLLGEEVEILERGLLDEISMIEIEKLKPEKEDFPLITRLRDGSSVVVGKRKILPIIQTKVEEIEKSGIKICALLCTEEFNEIRSKIFLIQPGRLIFNLTNSLLSEGNLLVFVPLKEQMEYAKRKWGRTGLNVFIETLNPYISIQEVEEMGEKIKDRKVDLIVMDCIGYSLDLKEKLKEISGEPFIIPRSILGMAIKEFL